MLSDFFEWIGSLWGDQSDYLECGGCRLRYQPHDDPGQFCSACGERIYAVIPHSEQYLLRYRCWKHDQKWWPQKMFALGTQSTECYQYWQWLGREWRHRPWEGFRVSL